MKFSILEEENLKLRKQIIENHITTGKISECFKYREGQSRAELNMTKLINNCEILALDKEHFSKKAICSKSIEEQMIEFRNEKSRKISVT